jgi:hypothetical protein
VNTNSRKRSHRDRSLRCLTKKLRKEIKITMKCFSFSKQSYIMFMFVLVFHVISIEMHKIFVDKMMIFLVRQPTRVA